MDKTYALIIDGEEPLTLTFDEFVEANNDDPWIIEELNAMKVGDKIVLGGGAGVEVLAERLS